MAKFLDATGLTYLWGKITAAFQPKITASGLLKGNGSGGVTAATAGTDYVASESDPTVPSWAKASSKPTYTASEVGAQPTITASGLLKGNGSGGVTAATAGTDYVASPEVFVATYGTTTNAEMYSAYTAGKLVVVKGIDSTTEYAVAFYWDGVSTSLATLYLAVYDRASTRLKYLACSVRNDTWSSTSTKIDPESIPLLSTDKLSSGTLGVERGGTGVGTFTSGAALIGNGTSAIQTRTIRNNTATSGAVTADTALITSNTLRYAINRTTSVAAADTNYSTVMARGIYAGTSAMTPGTTSLTNGVIYLQYNS